MKCKIHQWVSSNWPFGAVDYYCLRPIVAVFLSQSNLSRRLTAAKYCLDSIASTRKWVFFRSCSFPDLVVLDEWFSLSYETIFLQRDLSTVIDCWIIPLGWSRSSVLLSQHPQAWKSPNTATRPLLTARSFSHVPLQQLYTWLLHNILRFSAFLFLKSTHKVIERTHPYRHSSGTVVALRNVKEKRSDMN